MGSFKKKYVVILLAFLFISTTIGIFLHKEQSLEGTFYLVETNSAGKKRISEDFTIEIDGDIAIIKNNKKIEEQLINRKRKSFSISGKEYFYNYNSGHLSLFRKLNESEFDRLEFVNKASPLFESYQK
ncbi:TPA: hypothetical protein TZ704_001061 [Streptococcus suis]|nr:hypothetical protein [Streptococcus suis]